MEREKLGSRLGFILLSAGCAIGCGNVWKFPWMCGQYGGGGFVLLYFFCLVILGLPIMIMEFSVGRAAQASPIKMYQKLEKKGQKWHIHGYVSFFGSVALMAFYTVVTGWIVYYFVRFLTGNIQDLGFSSMITNPGVNVTYLAVTVVLAFGILCFGLQGGLERVTKYMMMLLLVLMLVLAVHSFTLSGAAEGLRFYLVPDLSKINGSVVVGAMNQAFFTLSVGMGAMAIFGSYIGKERSLMGESVHIILLDTFVAIVAGLIMFPACFTYGVEVNAGPSLLFDTMATVFNHMEGGRWWGTLFFLFMVFAALSTVLAVCEEILAMVREVTGWSRPVGCLVCGAGDLSDRPDHGTGLQRAALPALCRGHRLAGPVGFPGIKQHSALGVPGACPVLLQPVRLGMEQLPAGSQRRPGPEGAAMDEADVPVCDPGGHPVHLCLWHGDVPVEVT